MFGQRRRQVIKEKSRAILYRWILLLNAKCFAHSSALKWSVMGKPWNFYFPRNTAFQDYQLLHFTPANRINYKSQFYLQALKYYFYFVKNFNRTGLVNNTEQWQLNFKFDNCCMAGLNLTLIMSCKEFLQEFIAFKPLTKFSGWFDINVIVATANPDNDAQSLKLL